MKLLLGQFDLARQRGLMTQESVTDAFAVNSGRALACLLTGCTLEGPSATWRRLWVGFLPFKYSPIGEIFLCQAYTSNVRNTCEYPHER